MSGSRTQKSLKNILFSVALQIVTLLSNFIIKTVLIKSLGLQYTGLSTLFSDVLDVLSLAELGFGSAVIVALYRPIKDGDEGRMASLMKLFRRIYQMIFLIMLIAGAACMPFLRYIIKDVPDIKENIYVIFYLYVLKTAFSYLLIYKSLLLEANQEKNIVSTVEIICIVIFTAVECVLLAAAKSFILYFIASAVLIVVRNVIISFVADKKFAFLKKSDAKPVPREERKSLFKDVRALALYKICATLQRSVDSIVISACLGTGVLGLVSNYRMIAHNVDVLFGQIFEATKPSVGNLAVSESAERQYEVFRRMCFASFVVGNFIAVSLTTLFNPFIVLWLGEEYLVSYRVVLAIAADNYILAMTRPYENFRVANGLFIQGKYRPVFMIVINIALSLLLCKFWGVFGVLAATVIARLCTHVWYDPWLIYRKVFRKPFRKYIVTKLMYFSVTAACCVLGVMCDKFIVINNSFVDFLISAIFCAIIPFSIIFFVFGRTKNFKYFISVVKSITSKITKK